MKRGQCELVLNNYLGTVSMLVINVGYCVNTGKCIKMQKLRIYF